MAALVAAWTQLWLALWMAVAGLVVGAVVGLVEGVGHAVDPSTFGSGTTEGFAILGAAIGAAAGAVGGLTFVIVGSILLYPIQLVLELVVGAVFGGLITALAMAVERPLLDMGGARQMADSEEARIGPILARVGEAMGIAEATLPPVLIKPIKTPGAWCHCRHLVVSEGLLAAITPAQDEQLSWVLAHELNHRRRGDGIGLRFVWACALPVALLYNVGVWLAGGPADGEGGGPVRVTHPLLGAIGWFILWPTLVLSRYLIGPVTAWNSWQAEYAADQAAAAAVSREAGLKVLDALRVFEPGRSGFEAVLAQTHPPIAYRKDRLQPGWEPKPAGETPRPVLQRHPNYVIAAAVVVLALAVIPAQAGGGSPAATVPPPTPCVIGCGPQPTNPPAPTPTPYVDGQLVPGGTSNVGGFPVDYPDTAVGVAEHATNDAILLGHATDNSSLQDDLSIITSSVSEANTVTGEMSPLLAHDQAEYPGQSFVSELVAPKSYDVSGFTTSGGTVTVRLWGTVTVVSGMTVLGKPEYVRITMTYAWEAPDWRIMGYARVTDPLAPGGFRGEPPS